VRTKNAPNLASAFPTRKLLDAEEILSGMDEARKQIAAWLGIPLDEVYISVSVIGKAAFGLVKMPTDARDRVFESTRQYRVERRRVGFALICSADEAPAGEGGQDS
jgi:hypothetical protein